MSCLERLTVVAITSLVTCVVACSSSSAPGPTSAGNDPTQPGSSETGGPGAATGGGGGGGGGTGTGTSGTSGTAVEPAKLSCNAFAWCTTWTNSDAKSTSVANPPALDGGTIADGMYRLAQSSSSYTRALYFQGGSALELSTNASNDLGHYTIDGSRLKLAYETSCNVDGETAYAHTSVYAFKATPTGLFTAWVESDGMQSSHIDFWEKIDEAGLCTETDSYSCHVINCQCGASKSKPIAKCTI